jgi:hypothetical protein
MLEKFQQTVDIDFVVIVTEMLQLQPESALNY